MVKKGNAIQTIDTSGLIKKDDYNTEIAENKNKIPNHDLYITNQEFNKLTGQNFTERLKQVNLASKNDIADFVKKTDFAEKLINFNKKLLQIKQGI